MLLCLTLQRQMLNELRKDIEILILLAVVIQSIDLRR